MNLVQKVQPLLTIFGIDNGQETAVATRPALPMWQPTPGDTTGIERVINRIKQDGNVTIYEQEIVYIQSQAAPEPQPDEPYGFVTVQQPHPPTPEQWAILRDWQAGRAQFLGGSRHPADIIRRESGQVALDNGRIVLQE